MTNPVMSSVSKDRHSHNTNIAPHATVADHLDTHLYSNQKGPRQVS